MEIKAAYSHSKFGMFMFNVCAVWTKFIVKYRWLYYLLACTWGIIMTVLGALITGVLAIVKACGVKVDFKPYGWIYSASVGPDYWGGCEMGLMFLRDHKSSSKLDAHEFGHTFQNCLFGPLFPFLVAIPSASRYWYQEIRDHKGLDNVPYDSAWFEDAATQCGRYAIDYINNQNN